MSATENAQLESVVKVDVEAVMEEEMALIEEDQLVTEAEEAVMEGEAGDTKFERVEFYKKNGGARAVDKEEHIYKQYNSCRNSLKSNSFNRDFFPGTARGSLPQGPRSLPGSWSVTRASGP